MHLAWFRAHILLYLKETSFAIPVADISRHSQAAVGWARIRQHSRDPRLGGHTFMWHPQPEGYRVPR